MNNFEEFVETERLLCSTLWLFLGKASVGRWKIQKIENH